MKIKLNYIKSPQGQSQPCRLHSYNWAVVQEAAHTGMKVVGERVRILQHLVALDHSNKSEEDLEWLTVVTLLLLVCILNSTRKKIRWNDNTNRTLVHNLMQTRMWIHCRRFKYIQKVLGSHSDGQGTQWDAWWWWQAAVEYGKNPVCNHRELPAPTMSLSSHLIFYNLPQTPWDWFHRTLQGYYTSPFILTTAA